MGRPRTPTAIHELKGSFDKDPARGRARENEPKPTGPLGNPPADFTEQQSEVWHELVDNVPANVLTNADRHLVEMYCRVMAKLRAQTRRRSADNPDGYTYGPDLKVGELNFLMSCMSRMGMTPADRSKIPVPTKPDDDDDKQFFDNLAKRNLGNKPQ